MILYSVRDPGERTCVRSCTGNFWWVRRNGSSLLGWPAVLPALAAVALTWVIQEQELTLVWFHPGSNI
jgi:hypothetical protein